MTDINGVEIKAGDTVKTRQHPGGILPPAEPTTGIAEKTVDAFGEDTLRIRYRNAGQSFDRFILLKHQINEVVK